MTACVTQSVNLVFGNQEGCKGKDLIMQHCQLLLRLRNEGESVVYGTTESL